MLRRSFVFHHFSKTKNMFSRLLSISHVPRTITQSEVVNCMSGGWLAYIVSTSHSTPAIARKGIIHVRRIARRRLQRNLLSS